MAAEALFRQNPVPIPAGVKLALDWGERRIGVSACDENDTLAYPVATLDGADPWPGLARLLAEHRPVGLVVGLPRRLDGEPGLAARRIASHAAETAWRSGLPVWLIDERLTSAEAGRRLHQVGRTAKAQRGIIDQQAAVGILESVLAARRCGQEAAGLLAEPKAAGHTSEQGARK
ncbi:MAG: Holliday junction resolvase RuvX [Propionibacteriaceae bacterium]|nr:Holliday junction resolvase RuvX [Propionibacteriaceae bacterium]